MSHSHMVMVISVIVGIILGIILTFSHYFSDAIHIANEKHKMKIVSFAAGIFITYLFLELFPMMFGGDIGLTRLAFFFGLVAISLFHVIEKHIYIYFKRNENKFRKEKKEIHSFAFFFYYFVIGIVILNFITEFGIVSAVFLFIPIFINSAVGSVSLRGIHDALKSKRHLKFILSLSSLLGILFSLAVPMNQAAQFILLGFVLGAVLYINIVDSIPKEREGKPEFFLLGVFIYSVIIFISWMV